jgi:two-component system nitrogen regulation response regulator GlnG
MNKTILLADDDASLRLVLSQALSKEGFGVRATSAVGTLAKWVRDGEGDLVVSDVYMGEDSLFDTLPTLRQTRPDLPIIVMSGQSTVLTALSAAGGGAFDYLPKPFDLNELIAVVRRALSNGPDAKTRAFAASAEREEKMPLIGRSAAMQEVYRVLARVAATDLTVVLEGEAGVGKGRVAHALHQFSRRKDGPLQHFSPASAPMELLEAGPDGPGLLRKAHGGILYLNDVDDMPLDAQAQLLRVLQEGGANGSDVRIVAASKVRLADLARAGRFRQDLFFRLNVVSLRIPPLRERLDDLPDLARAFLVRARREGLPEKSIDASALELLKAHDWPGNVRELENLLRRVLALCPGKVISARDLERELSRDRAAPITDAAAEEGLDEAVRKRVKQELSRLGEADSGDLHHRLVTEIEAPLISLTLEATRGNQIRAAALLGINRNTLRKKISMLGLRGARDD